MCIVEKHRRVCLESLRYDWNQPDTGLSQTKCYPLNKTGEIESKTFPPESPSDYSDRGEQSFKSRFHQRSELP